MPDISKRLEKAEKYLQKSKPEAALEEYLAVLEEEADNVQVRQTAADLCLALGRNDEAATLLGYLFQQEIKAGDSVTGAVTYKKLIKLVTPTALQTFHYGEFIEKRDKKEALEAYETALKGFDAQGKHKQSLAAARRIVELAPTADNFQRAGEKGAALGESKAAALDYMQLGNLRHQESPGSGFEWYEKAYNLDPRNLQVSLLYAQGLFSRNTLTECIAVLTPQVESPQSTPELRDLLVRALVACKQPSAAEPYAWELYEGDPKRIDEICSLISAYLELGLTAKAMTLARKLEQSETKAGRLRDFIGRLQEVADKNTPCIELLEYLVQLFNTTNREPEYCRTLGKLFQLYYAAGEYAKAGEALDRAAEVDPYESGHGQKLELLRGKIDNNHYSAIANRFQVVANTLASGPPVGSVPDSEPTVLEDFILQAEIYLQYGMRAKALERIERIRKLFPSEEGRNEKLKQLYLNAGVDGHGAAGEPAAGAHPSASVPVSAPAPKAVSWSSPETTVDNFSKVNEITRNIHRQVNVKSVLFTAVNEIGRHFYASRCVAGLSPLGKPPSAALEYCATGVKPSDVVSLVKLIGVLQQLAVSGPVAIALARDAAELQPVQEHLADLGVESILAVPLMDAGEQCGIVILEQAEPRPWQPAEIEVLQTVAEQMVLAVSNARLRSLMKTLAVTEEKSGLLKRSSYLDVLLSEVQRSMQQQTPMTIMLLHFGKASALVKEIGEPQVEDIMQMAGQTICAHIRQNDVALRYDLTTIAVLLSDTNEKSAFLVVDKLRRVLASVRVPGKDRPPILSMGLAEAALQPNYDPVDIVTEVINRLESALEAARAAGVNEARALAPNLQPNAVA
jgi:GGDEF domain-containing protein/tetratricopeptide (TPR) repeat protein